MRLLRVQTGEEFEAEIRRVDVGELSEIDASGRFGFEWKRERGNEVFKINLKNETEVLGLVSLIDIPREMRIHVNLLELEKSHIGKNKKIDWIAGCLLAFAANRAFEKKYEGFVSLFPKTELIDVYVNKYGFAKLGIYHFIDRQASENLINKYLRHEIR